MRVVVLRSVRQQRKRRKERYLQEQDTRFAERVLGNLRGGEDACTACGPDCNHCRRPYAEHFGKGVVGVVDFPAVLPYVLERPADLLPREMPPHDVLLAIGIHEQILLEVAKACPAWGTRGIVAPLEAPGWICGATRAEAHRVCEDAGVEISFPKPFCSFLPPRGSVLAEFRESLHIGRPDVELTLDGRRIREARVHVSAACGATYCVARWLVGRTLDENLEIEVISKRWHAFPCTASMERDPELGDETPLHVAGQAHYALLKPHKKRVAGLESPMVVSPVGKLVHRATPPEENRRKIEEARQGILQELATGEAVTLTALRKRLGATPAALNTALLLLKREGAIRSEGTTFRRA